MNLEIWLPNRRGCGFPFHLRPQSRQSQNKHCRHADDLSERPTVTTLEPTAMGTTDSGQPKQQTIVVEPLAVFVPMKMLGTNTR
jgi:hypothetical protein